MSFSRDPRGNRRSFGHGHRPNPAYPAQARGSARAQGPVHPQGPVTPVVPPRRKPLPEGLIEKLCYENDVLKPKPDCRAALIDYCILEDDFDIDEAEDAVDKALRERNLWNEPSLEDILYGGESNADVSNIPSPDAQISEAGDIGT